jgi:very-short-patch-repair endonuclease
MNKSFIFNKPSFKTIRSGLRRNSTDAEKKLWSKLRNQQLGKLKFYRQYSIGSYILDFYCPKVRLAIELDGGQHAEAQQEFYDKIRSNYLKQYNIRILRFWNNEVLKNTEGIILKIVENLTPPSLPLD